MKKNIYKIIAVGAAALAILGFSGAYASFSDSVTVKNRVVTGDVNISLKEYQKKNGKETEYKNPVEILPGDFVSKIPRIKNMGMPCWIRTKLYFQNSSAEEEGLKEEYIQGISKDWKKIGEYYYYTKILGSGKSIDFFTGITIPASWTEAHSGQKLQVSLQTDAIQAANFTPDFQAMSPWGNQAIEKCIHETNGNTQCELDNVKLSVKFNGDAQKLLAVPDDFFRNFGEIMPGDVKKDTIVISNTDKKEVEILFYTGIPNQTKEQTALLEKLSLSVSMNGKNLYKGNLKASSLGKPVSLGKFGTNAKGTLEFSVSAPADLKNTEALRDASVNWTFAVKGKEQGTGLSPSGKPSNPDNSSVDYEDSQKGYNGVSSVKTGDESSVLPMVILLVLSAGTGIFYLVIKKKGDKKI